MMHIMIGEKNMKCMIIDNKNAFYKLSEDEKEKKITEINKEDLLILIHKMVETDDEFDEFGEDLIDNPAEREIYRNIYPKLRDLRLKKEKFQDSKINRYKKAIDKYTAILEVSNESLSLFEDKVTNSKTKESEN